MGAGETLSIKIGKKVALAPGIAFVAKDHVKGDPYKPTPPHTYTLEIGEDVWIGYGSILIMDLKIGKGAAIAAGSVVTHDVEPYDVVAGVPAKSIKKKIDKV